MEFDPTSSVTSPRLILDDGVHASLFKSQLECPLVYFLSLVYLSAGKVIETARKSNNVFFQSMFLGRHVMHLVILLNSAIDPDKGPTSIQREECARLSDIIRDLHTHMKQWVVAVISSQEEKVALYESIDAQHQRLVCANFSFRSNEIGRSDIDRRFNEMRAYDEQYPTPMKSSEAQGTQHAHGDTWRASIDRFGKKSALSSSSSRAPSIDRPSSTSSTSSSVTLVQEPPHSLILDSMIAEEGKYNDQKPLETQIALLRHYAQSAASDYLQDFLINRDGSGLGLRGPRGAPPPGGRGGGYPTQRGIGPRGGFGAPRGVPPAVPVPPPVKAPEEGRAVLDQRIASMQNGVEKFQAIIKRNKEAAHPLRPSFGTLGIAILVRANFFALKFPKGMIIYDYKIDITPKMEIREVKGRIIELLEESPDFAAHRAHIAHDRSERIVSSRKLPQPLALDILFRDEWEATARQGAKQYRVAITEVENGELNTDNLNEYTSGDPAQKDADIGRLVSALNLVVHASSARTGTRVGKNRYFFGPAQGNLGGGVEAWRGFYASVRPVWKSMMVNVNVCMTAFIEPKNMAVAITDYQGGSRGAIPNLRELFQKSTLRVKATHLGYKKKVRAIEPRRADQVSFVCEEMDNRKVTVAEYFRHKYQISLRYPDLPLLDLGSEKRPNYVPAELCEIIQGVPFRGRLQELQTSNMLNLACQTPQTNSNLIRGDGFLKLAIGESSRHKALKSFNITIDPQMTVVPSRILPPPGVTYRESRASIKDASWNLIKVKFHRGAPLTRFAVLFIQEEGIQPRFAGDADPNLWSFITGFAEACREAGMQVAPDRPVAMRVGPLPRRTKEDPSRTAAIKKIEEKMTMFGNSRTPPSIVVVLLNKYDAHLYAGIKRLGDVDLGVNTVCMLLGKATNPKRQAQYFANVALKVNAKLKGINHKLDPKDQKWLQEKRTMVVGADVKHPGPSSLRGAPSIAAVVSSVDSDFVQFPASMRLQNFSAEKEAQEMIHHWTDMMTERLEHYKLQPANRGMLPERVVIFRDGVSGGQFDLVLKKELPQIQDAFKRVYGSNPKPQLTICICNRRHHARFYPTDHNATNNGNTRPGTVVDKGVGDVYRFDFYLQAHAGLGTVKATHYTVVYNECQFSADTIQQGIHTSSYLYVRATKGVSLVPAAYYANLACERGQLYLDEFINTGIENSDAGKGKKDKVAAQKKVYDACVKSWGNGVHERLKSSMFYI